MAWSVWARWALDFQFDVRRPDAVRTVWPDTTVQTCVVHTARNGLRYASKRHWSKITKQLRAVYTASTVPAAEEASPCSQPIGKTRIRR